MEIGAPYLRMISSNLKSTSAPEGQNKSRECAAGSIRLEQTVGPTTRAVHSGLRHFNEEHAGKARRIPVTVSLRDNGEIVGGLTGRVSRGWFRIELFWVADKFRGKGAGVEILRMAEAEARRLGATRALVDTMSFQAPAFYMKHGYTPFARLDDHPPGHHHIWLQKTL